MKKLLYTSMVALAGLFMACSQEHIEAVYDPADVAGQQLGSIAGCTLAEDGAELSVSFTAADFGSGLSAIYEFQIASEASFAEPVKLSATISEADGTVSFAQKTLNATLLNFGAEADAEYTAYFRLASSLKNDKNAAIEGTTVYSNVVSATFVPYNAEVLDYDKYSHVWVIGASSAVGAWSFDKVHQYLYAYDGGTTYTGLIDFGEDGPSGGFKLTGVGNWDDPTKNWGSEAQAEESEATVVNIIAGNGSKDIKCYSHRYYKLSFDESAMTLTALSYFDNVGIVGAFNDWNAADENMKMTYNEYYHRFYIDMTFADDTELKFTCDDAWDKNWGVDMAPGGSNIQVSAGSYRIYMDLNKMTYEFSTSMFGKEEPGAAVEPEPEPEPTTYQGWGLIGSFNDWASDYEMTESDGLWTAYISLTADAQFKLRKDAGWDDNRGATGDVEPYVVALGEPFAVVNGGKNLAVPADGFYKVEYDSNLDIVTVSDGLVWGVIGNFNSWSGDAFMTFADGVWTSPAIDLVAGEGFKIRMNCAWDENRGAVGDVEPYTLAAGESVEVVNNGKNLAVAEDGQYVVTYNPEAETISLAYAAKQNCWSLIGELAGSSWNKDFYMTQVGAEWISDPVEIEAGKGFKIRFNNDWDINRGGSDDDYTLSMGMSVPATEMGHNMEVAESGTYQIVYDPESEIIYLLGWSLIGNIDGTGWGADYVMYPEDGKWYSDIFYVDEGLEFKFRYAGGWDINFGLADGVEFASATSLGLSQGGGNIAVPEAGYYAAILDAENQECYIYRADWSIVGEYNGWGSEEDVQMVESAPGEYFAIAELSGQWKIRRNFGWDENRGATGDVEPYEIVLGESVDVVQNGKNFTVEQGLYTIEYSKNSETIIVKKFTDQSVIPW